MDLITRAIVLLGPLLVLAAFLPWPGFVRAGLALTAVLVAWPLALWPLWRPLAGGSARPDRPRDLAASVRTLVGWAPLGLLPLLLLAVAGALGLPLSLLVVIWGAGLVGATGLGLSQVRDPRALSLSPPGVGPGLLALAGIALLVLWVHGQGPPLNPLDDAYDHIGTLRHLLSEDQLAFPGAFYGRDTPTGFDPRKGVFHLALALAARLARVDALEIWRIAPTVLAFFTGLVYLGLARAVFGRRFPAALALVALLVLSADPGRFVRGAYGGHWGLIVAWSGIALALSGGGALWGGVSGAACAGVHAYAPAQMLAPLVLLTLCRGGASRSEHDCPRGFIFGALAGAVPIEVLRIALSGNGGNPLHNQFMPVLLLPAGAIASPLELLRAWSLPGTAAAISLFVLGLLRRDRAFHYFRGAFLVPLLFLGIPGVFSLVGNLVGSVANKLLMVWEPGLAITAVLTWPWRVSPPAALPNRLIAGGAIMVTVLCLLPTIGGRAEMLLNSRPVGPSESLRTALQLIERETPPDAVIAADPVTAYAVPAFTGRRTIVTLHQHAPPGDDRALDRIAVTSALFSPCVEIVDALALARREGATHILHVPGPAVRVDQYANHTDPRNATILAARFTDVPGLRPVAESGHVRLFSISEGRVAAEGWLPTAGIPPAPGLTEPTVRVGSGTVELQLASVPEDTRWIRGESVRLPARWLRIGGSSSKYSEIIGHIRLENVTIPRIEGAGGVFSKPLRRLYLEKRAGGSFRWRVVELPFRGLCPPAVWPPGAPLGDTLEFTVPTNLIPGRYCLRVALETGTLYPVMTPADLLSDQDRFSGPVFGYVEIQ